MGIYVKGIAKCDGWHGWPNGKKFQQIPCTANDGEQASIEVDLELTDSEIADVGGDRQPSVIMNVVDDKGYHFSMHGNSQVQCPVCYALDHPKKDPTTDGDDDNNALSPHYSNWW